MANKIPITAQQLRALCAPRLYVDVPGLAAPIAVKTIDAFSLMTKVQPGTRDWLMANATAFQRLSASADLTPDLRAELLALLQEHIVEMGDFIDTVVCAAAMDPAVAREPQPTDSPKMWVEELPLDLKLSIFATATATSSPQVAATQPTPDTVEDLHVG